MQRLIPLGVFLIVVLTGATHADTQSDCLGRNGSPEVVVTNCTHLLKAQNLPKVQEFGAYDARATAYLKLNRFEEAFNDFTQAAALLPAGPRKAEILFWKGILRTFRLPDRFGGPEAAIGDMEAALEMEPPTELQVPILETLRSAYALSGKHDKALSLASKILDIDPSNSGARMYRAGMLEDQKDYEKAISDLDYLISNDPDDRGNYISRGRVFEKMGEKKAALADYKKAQEMKPDYRIAEQIEKLEQVQ